jgi:hypothetical protein
MASTTLDVREGVATHTSFFGSLNQRQSSPSPQNPQPLCKRSLHHVAILSFSAASFIAPMLAADDLVVKQYPTFCSFM